MDNAYQERSTSQVSTKMKLTQISDDAYAERKE